MWIGVLWAGLWVDIWITHVRGKFRHGLLEKSLNFANLSVRDLPKIPFGHKMDMSEGTNFRRGDFAPLEPELGAEFRETNFGRPNFGAEFLG